MRSSLFSGFRNKVLCEARINQKATAIITINKISLTIQGTKLFSTVENEKTSESKIQTIVKMPERVLVLDENVVRQKNMQDN